MLGGINWKRRSFRWSVGDFRRDTDKPDLILHPWYNRRYSLYPLTTTKVLEGGRGVAETGPSGEQGTGRKHNSVLLDKVRMKEVHIKCMGHTENAVGACKAMIVEICRTTLGGKEDTIRRPPEPDISNH